MVIYFIEVIESKNETHDIVRAFLTVTRFRCTLVDIPVATAITYEVKKNAKTTKAD